MDASKRRVYSEESRKKMSDAHKGMKNALGHHKYTPHYDLVWITNGVDNRLIHLGMEIPENWWQGRTFSKAHKEAMSKAVSESNRRRKGEKKGRNKWQKQHSQQFQEK